MANVVSLGPHCPTALSYLISECNLPQHLPDTSYTWHAYPDYDGDGEEEILHTADCVIWSANGNIRRVFKFNARHQTVNQALLTTFPAPSEAPHANEGRSSDPSQAHSTGAQNAHERMLRAAQWGSRAQDSKFMLSASSEPAEASSNPRAANRALVIVLTTELQIHYASGSSHVVNLPFLIDRAFSSLLGVIVQRKLPTAPSLPVTPSVPPPPPPPPPPPNSFLSQPSFLSQEVSQAAALQAGAALRSPHALPQLDALYQTLSNDAASRIDNGTPRFYSLAGPLTDFAPVFAVSLSRPSRLPRQADSDDVVEYQLLNSDESLVYVSSCDELSPCAIQGAPPLLLMVTVNTESQQITIWQTWSSAPQTLSALLAHRAAHKAARIRRRSSVLHATSSATPSVRTRGRGRESYAASVRLPENFGNSQHSIAPQQSQDDEEAMASQMDPDYSLPKQPAKTSKRVSSIFSRGELTTTDHPIKQTALGASFSGAGRRGPSLGSLHDRRSIGGHPYRKSRGSTPGSVFSKSHGPDDDLTEAEIYLGEDEDSDHEYSSATRLIDATLQNTGPDAVFGGAIDGLRREVMMRKIETLPLHWQPGTSSQSTLSDGSSIKVHTQLRNSASEESGRQLDVHVLEKTSKSMTTISYQIRGATQTAHNAANTASPTRNPIPVINCRSTTSQVTDMATVRDGNTCAIMYSRTTGEVMVNPSQGVPWPVQVPQMMKLQDSLTVPSHFSCEERGSEQGKTAQLSEHFFALKGSGSWNQVILATPDTYKHGLHVQLQPRDHTVRRILRVCQAVLPEHEGNLVPTSWCSIYHKFSANRPRMFQDLDSEWEALIVTLLSLFVGSVKQDIPPKPARLSKAVPESREVTVFNSQTVRRSVALESKSFSPPAWAWFGTSRTLRERVTPIGRSSRGLSTAPKASCEGILQMAEYEAMARHFLNDVNQNEYACFVGSDAAGLRAMHAAKVMQALHLFREEEKLNTLSKLTVEYRASSCLAAIIIQFGQWLGLGGWDDKPGNYYHLEYNSEDWKLSTSTSTVVKVSFPGFFENPLSVFQWLESCLLKGSTDTFVTIDQVRDFGLSITETSNMQRQHLPRISALQDLAVNFEKVRSSPESTIKVLVACGLTTDVVETLPEAIRAPMREAIIRCQSSPPTTWPSSLLRFVGREDLVSFSEHDEATRKPGAGRLNIGRNQLPPHDVQAIYSSADRAPMASKTHEAERHAVISLIFSEDRRFVDALRLMNPVAVQVAECPAQPEWSEVEHLDQQKRVMNWVMTRTIALAPGFAMIHFESQRPLLSEQFPIRGFNTSCQMKPMDNTISADRSNFTEEKFGWAFFHSGVSAGLSISRHAKGIDTSWIVFNKPAELSNRHAGFLLALGINGHLRTLAKWLAFKYLTPKHNMTSIGLLLGLSASYRGSMDTLMTRMLSVHITRMLPQGAAELNVSPSTQTAGLMGIGLLYHATQHRRMSEVMLSEIEHREIEDYGSTMGILRDESYRLAAGFALGLINLAQGRSLQGLHSMNVLERLLNVAIAPRPVELVHVVDKATAGAIIAVTLIYMKTEDQAVARKIDVPDTLAQLEHVRPDLLLLRTMAKHLILWNHVKDETGWIRSNLPKDFALRYYGQGASGDSSQMIRLPNLKSDEVPFFNILTGLAWALSLKFAGSGSHTARDEILGVLSTLNTVAKQEAYYYDAKLARNTVHRCIDVLGLAAATIMAGTGDLETFRYLRSLHGRVDPETSYGSHMAAHLAIGVLFLGGGTYTLNTSNFAIASLICAFYPLFPSDVSDNRVHLQAFRHLWAFAAEPRCLVVQDIDTARPIPMKLEVAMRDGHRMVKTSPCLLPELETISHITTQNPAYWGVTLDFAANPKHLSSFRRHQTIYVRRSPAHDSSSIAFSSVLTSLNDAQSGTAARRMWDWILTLSAFSRCDETTLSLVLPPDLRSAVHLDDQGTICDTQLVLSNRMMNERQKDGLWDLRLLFSWAQDAMESSDGRLRWIGQETINTLRARVTDRVRAVSAAA